MPTTKYLWDDETDTVLMEKDGANNVTAEYTHAPARYGRLLSQHRDGVTSHFHYDGSGNTRALTNADENVTDTYTYTAFGEEVATTGTTKNRYRYGGQHGYQHNEKTGDYHVRERVYEPTRGRWTRKDPLRFADGLNPYVYVGNGPVNAIDPSGLYTLLEAKQLLCRRNCKNNFDVNCYPKCFRNTTKKQTFAEWYKLEKDSINRKPNWTAGLPDCPCRLLCFCNIRTRKMYCGPKRSDSALFNKATMGTNMKDYHPGACFEIRSKAANAHGAGQQCTYDWDGDLINGGYAAGTPDKVAASGFFTTVNWWLGDIGHIGHDVSPFDLAADLDGSRFGKHVDEYLEVRPPNKGKDSKGKQCPDVAKKYPYVWPDPCWGTELRHIW